AIEEICRRASAEAGRVVPANYNAPGQVVVSGEVAGVERAMALAKEAGAKRAMRLNVSGAFHSPLMDMAAAGLEEALAAATIRDPTFPVYANIDGQPVADASRAKEQLLQQLTSPVRWTDEVRTITRAYPGAL